MNDSGLCPDFVMICHKYYKATLEKCQMDSNNSAENVLVIDGDCEQTRVTNRPLKYTTVPF